MMFGASSRTRVALIVSLFAGAAFFAVPALAGAATVTIDGQSVTPVVQRNGHLLIPFRVPMERLGARVNWLNPTASARLHGQQLVTINVGSSNALIKGTPRTLSARPELIDGAAFVPVGTLADICGAHVVYSANHTVADVTGCNLARINAIAAGAPGLPAAPAVPTPAVPPAQRSGIPWWVWLIVGLGILGGLWARARARAAKPVYETTPNVVRGTIDDYVPRLKNALDQTDDAHRASFVQQLSQTFNENRSTIPEPLIASTREYFDAAASGSAAPVRALVDRLSGRPQILQMAAQRFIAQYPGELGALSDVVRSRM